MKKTPEHQRLLEDAAREQNWKRWGPYLSERQWGTVREDYSSDGEAWTYFPHDHAALRTYRWGEDGLLGLCDRQCRLCFSIALWNTNDPILKERLFGLSGPEGNHGEDVKECYFYLDSTPTHSYSKAVYKYPQAEFPYSWLREESARRGREGPSPSIMETGVFEENRYFDVNIEYAKASPSDLLARFKIHNPGPEDATLYILPTVWFRNTWTWGCRHEGSKQKPSLKQLSEQALKADHDTLGKMLVLFDIASDDTQPELVFTDNETNTLELYGDEESAPYCKDAFHRYIIQNEGSAVNPDQEGTKAAAIYLLQIPSGGHVTLRVRMSGDRSEVPGDMGEVFDTDMFDDIIDKRRQEADDFYAEHIPPKADQQKQIVARRAYGGLLWSKQFYHYIVTDWLRGDEHTAPPPAARKKGRNHNWEQLYARDVISMPDKWEYPWFAAWDVAFHMLPLSRIDPHFAKKQLLLLLREWYMHPNGQLPAYEYGFGDVNPPVHAWACWRVYKMTGRRGHRDRQFLASAFQKLLLNFTWWVNRFDHNGDNVFSGGFLGLDNIGIFDRSKPLPTGGHLEQADGTSWMAFYCSTMLSMALELAREQREYADMASKFFEHFVRITDAMNTLGGSGLWDDEDGFYYDHLRVDGQTRPIKTRSLVGLLPLIAVDVLDQKLIERLPGFQKRTEWFLTHRKDLSQHISLLQRRDGGTRLLLAIPNFNRLRRMLKIMLDEDEFLSPFGIRSLSKYHQQNPVECQVGEETYSVAYNPGESDSGMFGGNSNWRGPIWFPTNFLLIEALERYFHFYGNDLKVECPTGSGQMMNLQEVSRELNRRLSRLFLVEGSADEAARPCHGSRWPVTSDPHWDNLILFHEYFHGDTGEGLGASHQTGWTALITNCIEKLSRQAES